MAEHVGQYPPPLESIATIAAINPDLSGQLAGKLSTLHHTRDAISDVENWQPLPEVHASLHAIDPAPELAIIAGISAELHQKDPLADHDSIMQRTSQFLTEQAKNLLTKQQGGTHEEAVQIVSTGYCLDAINKVHGAEPTIMRSLVDAGLGDAITQASTELQNRGMMVRGDDEALHFIGDVLSFSEIQSALTSENNAEATLIPKQYDTLKPLFVRDELRPIETNKFVGPNGIEYDLPVLAKFDTIDPATSMVLTKFETSEENKDKPSYAIAVVRDGEDGSYQVHDHKMLDFGADARQQMSISDNQGRPLQTVFVEQGDDGANFKWKINVQRLNMQTGNVSPGSTFLHQDQDTALRGKSGREREQKKESRIRGWKERLGISKKIVIGMIAVKAVLGSGGFVDQVGEKFNDAASVAEETIELPDEPRLLTPNDVWADGVLYMNAPAGALEESQATENEEFENSCRAKEAIVNIVEQLDENDYGAIRDQAYDYIDEHRAGILSAEQLQNFYDRIDNATTNEETLTVLNEFAQFFNLTAQFQTKTDKLVDKFDPLSDTDLVKDTASRIINVLGWLPKEVVETAALKTIQVGTSTAGPLGGVGGYYDPNDFSLHVPVRASAATELWMDANGLLQAQDMSQEAIIAHEFAHALDYGPGNLSSPVPLDRKISLEDGMLNPAIGNAFWGGILQYPQDVSAYARTSTIERTAENLSSILYERTDGIAAPDEWRRFNSPANKELLYTLYKVEKQFPGLASYLVANNNNLMGHNGLDTFPVRNR